MHDVRVVAVVSSNHSELLVRRLRRKGIEAQNIRGNGRVAVFLPNTFLGRGNGISRWEAGIPSEISPGFHEVKFRVNIRLAFRLFQRGRRKTPDLVALAVREMSGREIYPSFGSQNETGQRCVSGGARLVMLSRIGGEMRDIWICQHTISDPVLVDHETDGRDRGFVIYLEQRTPFFGPLAELPRDCSPCAGEAQYALARGGVISLEEADEFLRDMRPFASWS